MGLRRANGKEHWPPPAYYPGCTSLSIVFHWGGECETGPPAVYRGGEKAIYDHVNLEVLDFWLLQYLLSNEGVVVDEDEAEYFIIEEEGFKLISDGEKLKEIGKKYIKQRLLNIFVGGCAGDSSSESHNGNTGSGSKSEDGGASDEDKSGDMEDVGTELEGEVEEAVQGDVEGTEFEEELEEELGGDVDGAAVGGVDDVEGLDMDVGFDYDWGNNDGDDEGLVDVDVEEANFVKSDYEGSEGLAEVVVEEDNLERAVVAVLENESDKSEDDMVTAGNDFDERRLSDEDNEDNEGGSRAPVFNSAEKYKPNITLAMLFATQDEFKDAVKSLAVNEHRQVKFFRTTPTRVYAKCLGKDCEWKIYAHRVPNETTLQVTRFDSNHTCMETYDVPAVNSKWLADRFLDRFVSDPKRSAEGFRLDVIKELKVNVTKNQAISAKRRALTTLSGSSEYQFSKLWEYAEELRQRNPGSTVILGTEDVGTETRFDRFYVCFEALKKGWRIGCRPLIGVDGCHLSGPHKGILLTAVGVDGNNQLYPIAYAIIPIENRDNWAWFLHILKHDLQLDFVRYLTFISDRQKGLVQAMQEIFPGVDHRFCVRHMHNNFTQAGYRGLALKNMVWAAARAGTVPEFASEMNKIKAYSEGAWKWLSERAPTQWTKSHFSEGPMCDMLLNNLCESFNGSIKEAHSKTIISSLEWIREYIMTTHSANYDRAVAKWAD